MAKEICISSTPHETRLAILEDDQLAEIYYERENEYTLAGSIYNGRVTRVLPGMQSAFVDLGLERDAFLYVTDFLELEDAEETDELEKAAASSGNQPPREVRHGGSADGRGRPGQKPEQRPEQRQERAGQGRPFVETPPRGRVLIESEAEPEEATAPAPEPSIGAEVAADGGEESAAPGAKRWRGRRRRRGGRGGQGATEELQSSDEAVSQNVEEIAKADQQEIAQQSAAVASTDGSELREVAESAPRFDRTPAAAPIPFVMPGESLSKYGGSTAEDVSEESPAQAASPARPVSTFKPSTLIQSPIEWDGSGLLPGESLSRRRGAHSEPVKEEPIESASESVVAPVAGSDAPDLVEEEELVEETTIAEPRGFARETVVEADGYETSEEEFLAEPGEDDLVEEDLVAGTSEAAAETAETAETAIYSEPQVETAVAQNELFGTISLSAHVATELEANEPEPDAAASHDVDPVPPTGFRLFGLGKKKKAEEETPKPEAQPAAAKVSSYAPGSGVIVEETIEEEEFDVPRHAHVAKGGDHDQDDFEEETLPTHLRTGDLGEMLQEAHLDHRIQLNFDDKNGDEEELEDEDEEEPSAEGRPAGAAGQQRRDRNARGRRGRNGSPLASQGNRGRGPSRRSMQMSDLPIISDLLKSGQEILVQIAKEPIAKKGARITSHIALPGRFLVFMPTVSHIGVSRKIASDEERHRLKRILVHERGEASGGFIVRTAADGASEEELRTDLRFLLNLWADIKKRSDESKSPALIYHDLGLIERILRDQVSTNFSSIWVDSEADYERIVRFLNRFSPSLTRRVKLYTKETPLFEQFGIQDEISKALRSKVWLKSGGSIVINQTEALVAIDINTGKYVGKSARLEDTIVKTNLDAVPEIVRQIRLRDLGGIIVIDFIDMNDRKNRYKVMAALEEALKSDRAPTKVLQFNDFGLVAITRKRVKQSLERTLSVPCPTCQATGMVKSPTTVCNEIYTELRKMKRHFEGADVLLRVNPETVKVLKANNGSWLTEFEELVSKNILVKSDATLHPEQFDIQG